MPRRLAPFMPCWSRKPPKAMLPPSVRLLVLALRRATISAAVVRPCLTMSCRVSTCTGSAVSDSRRLMAEPVTSTFCNWASTGGCWAQAGALARHSSTACAVARGTNRNEGRGVRIMLMGLPDDEGRLRGARGSGLAYAAADGLRHDGTAMTGP